VSVSKVVQDLLKGSFLQSRGLVVDGFPESDGVATARTFGSALG
jgi:translation initiation factor 2B subunit (eIF-2B alpha/beta/delta family)